VPNTQLFNEVKADMWKYDFETRNWTRIDCKALPTKTEHSAVVYNNKLWLFGGYSGKVFTNSLYSYDFRTNECIELQARGEIPPQRSAHIAVVHRDSMYIFGGWNGTSQNNDLYKFSFATLTWNKVLHTGNCFARCSHSAVVSERDKALYIFGGYGGKGQKYLADLLRFDFDTSTWTEIKPVSSLVPTPRSRAKMVEVGNKLCIFGGWNKVEHFNSFYEFDLSLKTWTQVPTEFESETFQADEGKIGQHTFITDKNLLYIFGGYNTAAKTSTANLYVTRFLPKQDVDSAD